MQFFSRYTVVAAAGALLIVGGVAVVVVAATNGGDDDENEQPITGDAYDRASAAALEFTGGGTVSETEVDDEDSKYEVEVTLADGSEVDVQLDENFVVVGSEGDNDDGPDDD